MEWKDVTSYSREERGKMPPRTWELGRGVLRVTVTRWHGCDGWFLTCSALNISRVQSPHGDDLAAAQQWAVAFVSERLDAMRESLLAATGGDR